MVSQIRRKNTINEDLLDDERLDFQKKMVLYMVKKLMILSIIVVLVLVIGKAYYDTNVFKVNTVQFHTDKLPADHELTILQISDLHNKVFDDHNEPLIHAVKQLDADLIVMTGDMIDRSTTNLQDVFALVDQIMVLHSEVYFVTGNHEWGNARMVEFLEGLQERGVHILNNRHMQVTIDQAALNLVGVDDPSTHREDVEAAFRGVDRGAYTILLAHAPELVNRYNDIPADLILSGHTHGGQIRLPFIGALAAPGQGLLPKLDKGVFTIGQDQYLYIDSGLGTSLLPIRFLNQSQMSLIRVVGTAEG